jgi:hypothetical protein
MPISSNVTANITLVLLKASPVWIACPAYGFNQPIRETEMNAIKNWKAALCVA